MAYNMAGNLPLKIRWTFCPYRCFAASRRYSREFTTLDNTDGLTDGAAVAMTTDGTEGAGSAKGTGAVEGAAAAVMTGGASGAGITEGATRTAIAVGAIPDTMILDQFGKTLIMTGITAVNIHAVRFQQYGRRDIFLVRP